MNDANPSTERLRTTPGEIDPTSLAFQEMMGQKLEHSSRSVPRVVTASANVNPLDDEIRVDSTSGSVTMTLETAIGCDGRRHIFKKTVAANSMVIEGNGSETLDGAANVTRTGQYDVVAVISNGTNWDLEYAGPGTGASAGGGTVISSGNLPAAATHPVTDIPAMFNYLVITMSGASSGTATRFPLVQLSVNNGSSYDTTAGNYEGMFATSATALAVTTAASICQEDTGIAATTFTVTIRLDNYQGTGGSPMYYATYRDSTGVNGFTQGIYIGSASPIDAIQFAWNGSGNFDAGTYTVKGY